MGSKENESERKFILECIELYETLPALWNVKCKEYSNRNKKAEQYEVLLSKYQQRFPEADKVSLIKKFNSLRTNFRKELKRIDDSKKSGVGTDDVLEPTLWYFDEMKFLTQQEQPCSSQSSMTINDGEEDSVLEEIEFKEIPAKRPKKKKDETDHLISLACKRLAAPKTEHKNIGATWATELEKMEPEQQLFAKKAINDILFEGQMGTLHRNSVQINQTIHSSTPYENDDSSNIIYYESLQEELNEPEFKASPF